MPKYRKKPIEVEAVLWTGSNEHDLDDLCSAVYWSPLDPEDRGDNPDHDAQVYEKNHSRWISFGPGTWIIKGTQGELYPCDPQSFADVYDWAPATDPIRHDCGPDPVEIEGCDKIRGRMADLLTQTANALKGLPGPLVQHDWADLPVVARELTQLIKIRTRTYQQMEECPTCGSPSSQMYALPDGAGFSTGASPSCNDPWHKHPELRRHHSDPGAVYAEEEKGRGAACWPPLETSPDWASAPAAKPLLSQYYRSECTCDATFDNAASHTPDCAVWR